MSKLPALLLLSLLLSTQVAAADARALFQSGSKALAEGKADEAVTAFEAAYAAQPAPSLLFWLGEAYRAKGDKAKAIGFYEDYLKKLPDGPKKADAQARLTELRSAKRAERKTRRSRKVAAKPPPMALMPLTLDSAPASPPAAKTPAPAPAPQPPSASATQPPATKPAEPVAATPAPAPPPPPVVKAPISVAVAGPPPARPPAPMPRTPIGPLPERPAEASLIYVSYTARILVVNGSSMQRYSTLASPTSLFTHGFAVGRQTENFKNAVYFGFGTEIGTRDGSDTLHRYEVSWQCLWTPMGPDRVLSPHLGFRLGGLMLEGQFLTAGLTRPGIVAAPMAGVDLQLGHYLAVTAGMGYDLNLGPDLGPKASVSGYSFDLGGTVRF